MTSARPVAVAQPYSPVRLNSAEVNIMTTVKVSVATTLVMIVPSSVSNHREPHWRGRPGMIQSMAKKTPATKSMNAMANDTMAA